MTLRRPRVIALLQGLRRRRRRPRARPLGDRRRAVRACCRSPSTELGQWRVEARAGAADADPYTRARVERSGEIPLALGEGLRLTTRIDSDGRALDAALRLQARRRRRRPRATGRWRRSTPTASRSPTPPSATSCARAKSCASPTAAFWIWISRARPCRQLAAGRRRRRLRPGAAALRSRARATRRSASSATAAPSVVRVRCG